MRYFAFDFQYPIESKQCLKLINTKNTTILQGVRKSDGFLGLYFSLSILYGGSSLNKIRVLISCMTWEFFGVSQQFEPAISHRYEW